MILLALAVGFVVGLIFSDVIDLAINKWRYKEVGGKYKTWQLKKDDLFGGLSN